MSDDWSTELYRREAQLLTPSQLVDLLRERDDLRAELGRLRKVEEAARAVPDTGQVRSAATVPAVVTITVTNHGPWHGFRAAVAVDEQGNPPAVLNIEPDRSITNGSGRIIGHLLGDTVQAPDGAS